MALSAPFVMGAPIIGAEYFQGLTSPGQNCGIKMVFSAQNGCSGHFDVTLEKWGMGSHCPKKGMPGSHQIPAFDR